MRYRRNVDEAMRRLERAVAAGDDEATVAYLFKIAQQGTWFLPHEWRAPSGFPHASNVNTPRAYYVRLLSFLRWPGAKELVATVASQAPVRPMREYKYMWGERKGETYQQLDAPEPMHCLAQAHVFAKIGPQTAEGIGVAVMEALAGAAAHYVFPLTKVSEAHWEDAAEAVRGLRRGDVAYREHLAAGTTSPDAYALLKEEQEPYKRVLWKVIAEMRPPSDASFTNAASAAGANARNSYVRFFDTFGHHRSDMAKYFADAFEHATDAAAWACEADRGQKGVHVPPTSPWGSGSLRPSRGCATAGNRAVKQAVTPSVLSAIAVELMRYR